MWKLTKEEFSSLRLLNGQVVIKPIPNNQITYNSLILDVGKRMKDEMYRHQSIRGTIIKVCDRLRYIREIGREKEYDMFWLTDIEVVEGDLVIYDMTMSLQAFGLTEERDIKILDVEGDRYIIIPYSALKARIRGDEIIGLNGLLLVEPINPEESTVYYIDSDDAYDLEALTKRKKIIYRVRAAS